MLSVSVGIPRSRVPRPYVSWDEQLSRELEAVALDAYTSRSVG